MSSGPFPSAGLPKVIVPVKSRQPIGRRLLAIGHALTAVALLAGCSRTARPVPIPDQLQPWTTTLESPRRDAWVGESAPLRPERAWTMELGRGVVGPLAIEADLVFATTFDRRLIVLSASTGSIFWERRLAGAAPSGAVFDRTSVFVASQDRDGSAEAYELARGFLVWRKEIQPPIGAPLLHERVTYWGTETGHLYALSAADGSELWRLNLAGGVVATPILDGGDLLVVTNADTLYRVDMRTGRVTERMELPATPSATPAFDGRYLHLPLHDTTYAVVDVRDRRVVSSFGTGAQVRSMPVLDRDGAAYVLTEAGTVLRVRADGAEPFADVGGAARASIALAANGVLVGRLDGALFLLDFEGNVVWREDFDDSIEAPVAIYHGAVYVPMLRGDLTMLRESGS